VPLTRLHAERAWVDGRVAERVLLEVDGGRFTAVRPGADPPPGALRLPGLVLPGLANAHSHAFHRVLRGRAQEPGDFWSWRRRMYEVAGQLDPDTYRDLARAVYAEMALAGVTAVGEFHYLHHGPGGRPYADPNAMGEALIAAAGDAGVRLTLLDTCYLRGGFGTPLEGPQLRFGDGDAERWAERVDGLRDAPGVLVGAAVHSVRAVDPGGMKLVRDWAEARGTPLHLHLSEQRAENEACLAATGRTPTALAAAAGVLGPATTAVHATHLAPADVAALGATATVVCLCPTTERDLADGIGPAVELAAAGSPLCVGSDSQAVVDLFEEARAVELDQRLRTQRRGHLAGADLLAAATAGGMRSLGWDVALRPGALADLVAVDTGSPRTAGVPPEAIVFAATAADVTDVVVGGRHIVRDGRHLSVDVRRALAGVLARLGSP
jgi:formiminoglutamate deiminase